MTRPAAVALAAALLAAAGQAASEPDPKPAVHTLAVAGDKPIEVVDGPQGSRVALVYLHGRCGNPFAFRSWSAAAARHGTLIALRGDDPGNCNPGRTLWSQDLVKHDRRVTAAIARANAFRAERGEAALDGDHVTLIGYSQGSRRAEWLAGKFPERFTRVALIAGAFSPTPDHFTGASKVLVMAGELDVKKHLIDGEQALEKAGIHASYLELPKAHHGEYGPDAPRVMARALDWLLAE